MALITIVQLQQQSSIFFYYFLGKLVGYSIFISFHTVSFEYYFRLGKQHFARSYRGRLVCSTC
ncbi:hypothetical protein VCR15J2_60149 [Vibrio coralliirubri]|nr:hypothetical protein VCR15J2_60149 [Vibrio coralliirubri]